MCEDIILTACRTIGRNLRKTSHSRIIHLKDRMTSKYGHHDMLISLINWIIVRANQSERTKHLEF